MKKFIPLIIFIVVVIFLYLGLGKDAQKLPSPFIDKEFPNIVMKDYYTGKTSLILDSLKNDENRWSLVSFWASWCVTCRVEHPMLMKIARSNSVQLMGINYKDKKSDAQRFLNKSGNPFNSIVNDYSGSIGLNLGVYALPESFLVDSDGVIRYKHLGEMTEAVWKEKFLTLIE